MVEMPTAPNTLTVVFHDDGATRYIGTPPTSRSVRLPLTDEQIAKLAFRGSCESITAVVLDYVAPAALEGK